MDLGSLLSGPIGAITGTIGAIGSKIIDYKMEGLKNEHELAMKDKETELAKLGFSNKIETAKMDQETQKLVKDLEALRASVEADKAAYGESVLGRIVDFMRGITRPLITYASMSLIIYDTIVVMVNKESLTLVQRMEVINTSTFLAGVAITWWFGTRPNRK